MNIIEWLQTNVDAGDALIISLISLGTLFILYHLFLTKILEKFDFGYDLLQMGPILGPLALFCILLFLSIITVLFISSVQAISEYGIGMIFALLLFWGGFITISVLIIRYIKK